MAPEPGDLPAPPDVAAAPADAEKTASGLASKVIKKGTGTEHPEAQDAARLHQQRRGPSRPTVHIGADQKPSDDKR